MHGGRARASFIARRARGPLGVCVGGWKSVMPHRQILHGEGASLLEGRVRSVRYDMHAHAAKLQRNVAQAVVQLCSSSIARMSYDTFTCVGLHAVRHVW